MRSKKIRVYRTVSTVPDGTEIIDGVKHHYKKVIRYWAFTCPVCRMTYSAKPNPEMPWSSVLTAALEHPKYCSGNLVESLMESLTDAMRGATQ